MAADPAEYPLRRTTDARSALSGGLRGLLEGLRFSLPRTTESFGFAAVYAQWASFSDSASSGGGKIPAAAVLPDKSSYDGASLTPRLLEETWSGGDPTLLDSAGRPLYPLGDGTGDGYALASVAELSVSHVVLVRALSRSQRKAIVVGIEEALVEDGTLLPDSSSLSELFPLASPDAATHPVRYGRVVELPAYYGRRARYTLLSQQLLDSESLAAENRWLAQFEVRAEVRVCVRRRVRAMKPRVSLVVGGREENR